MFIPFINIFCFVFKNKNDNDNDDDDNDNNKLSEGGFECVLFIIYLGQGLYLRLLLHNKLGYG